MVKWICGHADTEYELLGELCIEYLSKFDILRPLKSKTADDVATELLLIFLDNMSSNKTLDENSLHKL